MLMDVGSTEHVSSNSTVSEAALLEPEAFTLAFTRDRALIRAYEKLRDSLYKHDRRFVGFRGSKGDDLADCSDFDNQMLILHRDGQVHGGAAIRVSTPDYPVMFSLEHEIPPAPGKFYFSLKEALPELELHRYAYAEVDEIVLHPSLRVRKYTQMFFRKILSYFLELRVQYMFATSDRVRSRLYHQLLVPLDVDLQVLSQIDIPIHSKDEKIKRQLLYYNLEHFYADEKV